MERRQHLNHRCDSDDENVQKFEFTVEYSVVEGVSTDSLEPDQTSIMPAPSIEAATSASSIATWNDNVDESASLSDSVQTFPKEFGRTYHAYRAGSYAFPNDISEQDRLELQGKCIEMLLDDRLFFSPLSPSKPPRNILDVATGVGDWAVQMGDLFPSALIIGTDLSPIQPTNVPPNVHFYVEDSTDPWDFPHQFDYIHTRATSGSWADFENQIAKQAFDSLEPGGWFESQEIDCNICCDDGTLDLNGPLVTWSNDLIAASDKLNRPAIFGAVLKEILERVGFVDVQQRIFKMPIGGWAKDTRLREIGYMWGLNLLEGLAGFSYQLFNKAFERTTAEIEVSLIDVRRDLTNPRIHCYMPAFVVWGKKPYPSET